MAEFLRGLLDQEPNTLTQPQMDLLNGLNTQFSLLDGEQQGLLRQVALRHPSQTSNTAEQQIPPAYTPPTSSSAIPSTSMAPPPPYIQSMRDLDAVIAVKVKEMNKFTKQLQVLEDKKRSVDTQVERIRLKVHQLHVQIQQYESHRMRMNNDYLQNM